TVNFDDPTTYHLYYGDEVGRPGTIVTFFPWPGAGRGQRGAGQTVALAFSVPPSSVGYWIERCQRFGVPYRLPARRFDESVLRLDDPDGLPVELVAHAKAEGRGAWEEGPVPAANAVRGVHSVTLLERDRERTAGFLTETMGFRAVGEWENRFRFEVGTGGAGSLVDVLHFPNAWEGLVSVGTLHHVAWRVSDVAEQARWRLELAGRGADVTSVVDRQYFQSVYFHEPGGVLFELATDGPGFAVDETPTELGTRLQLPPWLETRRTELEQSLPELELPLGESAFEPIVE
ncbi:MAG: ring-cleaving dioxygenase, partial [Chloroflexi bacterium]|nr:ring-cleaving dioxygenase [Chloroflexota bacterium]